MKKVTMKDFRWVGKPQQWTKTYRALSLTVGANLRLPDCPLMLAVSDDDFTLSLTTSVAPEGGLCGLCLYHTDENYTAVGRSKSTLQIESSVRSYRTTSQIPFPTDGEHVQWHLERKGKEVRIGCARSAGNEQEVVWLSSTTIPAMGGSVSFGVFFSNFTNTPFVAGMHSLHYEKDASPQLDPLVQPTLI